MALNTFRYRPDTFRPEEFRYLPDGCPTVEEWEACLELEEWDAMQDCTAQR